MTPQKSNRLHDLQTRNDTFYSVAFSIIVAVLFVCLIVVAFSPSLVAIFWFFANR